MVPKPLVGQDLLINEDSPSQLDTPRSGRLIGQTQRSLPENTQHSDETDFIPRRDSNPQFKKYSSRRPLDCAIAGIGAMDICD